MADAAASGGDILAKMKLQSGLAGWGAVFYRWIKQGTGVGLDE